MKQSNSRKVYVAFKPCPKPNIMLQWNGYGGKDAEFVNATESLGLEYYEDDIGYYSIRGWLELDID